MQLIKSSVERLVANSPVELIETAGRTCYKSEAQEGSSPWDFYGKLEDREHYAMLEHATFVFEMTLSDLPKTLTWEEIVKEIDFQCQHQAVGNPFVNISYIFKGFKKFALISLNLRTILENQDKELIRYLTRNLSKVRDYGRFFSKLPVDTYQFNHDSKFNYIPCIEDYLDSLKMDSEEYDLHMNEHKYFTIKFVCDRGVSHELVRHRRFSFAQESTRYVNYAKNPLGMLFIEPADYSEWNSVAKEIYIDSLRLTELHYLRLVEDLGFPPQKARAVLCNSIKTEVVVTGNVKNWIHFLKLRSLGITGAPHPDMKVLADMLLGNLSFDCATIVRTFI